MTKHLLVDISGHGYGHAGQTAPVLKAIVENRPDIRLTVRTRVPHSVLEDMVGAKLTFAEPVADVTMAMFGPDVIDVDTSKENYRTLHQQWNRCVALERKALSALAPDLLLTNVAYTTLVGASDLAIPAIALCSLNWADIFEAYGDIPGPDFAIVQQIRETYNRAATFLLPTPHMPTAWHRLPCPIGPIGRKLRLDHKALRQRLHLGETEKLVLVSYGGIQGAPTLENFPVIENLRYIYGDGQAPQTRPDMLSLTETGLSFIEAMALADCVITKPGYGIFVEAALNNTRVLFSERGDWPEYPYLKNWLLDQACAQEISRSDMIAGNFVAELQTLLQRPCDQDLSPTGITDALEVIGAYL